MEIVSFQRQNYLWLLFRFIKVYTKHISWPAIAGNPVVKTIGRFSKLSVNFFMDQRCHFALRKFPELFTVYANIACVLNST